MARYVGFVRGINVGKAKRISMADLRTLCEGLGFEDVRTQGQSGNIVLDSKLSAAKVAAALTKAIDSELDIEVTVVVRTPAQLRKVVDRNPFAEVVTVPRYSSVSFLQKAPGAGALKDIDAAGLEPDLFELHGSELYMWMPKGQMESPLPRILTDKRLGTAATNRNWNTLLKVLEIAEG
jgi:uncharacterized protein (DUF1697 family)